MTADLNTFSGVFGWIIAHGYWLMFIVMLVEGPVVTAAGAFAAKLGYFNIYIVFLISILGNIIPDIIYYGIGYWGRTKVIDRFAQPHFWNKKGAGFKLSHEKIIRLESLMERHAGKTLLVVKLLPLMAVPGLIAAGAVKMSLRKYITFSMAIILPTSLLFLLVGYYVGVAYASMIGQINNIIYLLAGAFAVFLGVVYIWRKVEIKLAGKIEKI